MADKRLLLVEDDFEVAELLLMYFNSHQYEVIHAESGHSAIEMARTRLPHLILLDVMLPDMDGFEVCQALRDRSLTKHIPIIFLTQLSDQAYRVQGLALGADDYVTKPFDLDELRLRVQGAIRRATRDNLYETRTGLPSSAMIDDEVSRRQAEGETFSMIQMHLRGFESFSDAYGFLAANEVFTYAGRVLADSLGKGSPMDDFIGVHEDTLVLISTPERAEAFFAHVKQRFDAEVLAFYAFADSERGGILRNPGTAYESVEPFITLERIVPA